MTNSYFDTEHVRIAISIIWGLLLACIFKLSCKSKRTIMIKAPNPELLKSHIIKFNDSCYQYDKYDVACQKKDTNHIEK